MYKLILQDYRSHWRSSLKRLYNYSTICFVWLFYAIIGIGSHEDNELSYILLTIPCFLAYMLARMYGGYLNKTFYLCPLDADARRTYAIQSFRLRIIIPSILFIVGNVILLCLGYFAIEIFLIRLIVYGCTAFSVNIYCQPTVTDDIYAPNRYPFIGNFESANTYSNIINILNIIILMSMEEYSIRELSLWELVLISLLLILQLAATIRKARRFYWQSIVVMEFYK